MRLAGKGTIVIAAAVLSLLCIASTAAAASSPFGCRASFARVGLGGSTVLEPLVANSPGTPCANDGRGLSSVSVPTVGTPIVKAGPAAVYTATSSAPAAAALASVDGVTIPTSGGPILIAGPVYAETSYSCVNGSVVSNATSTLDLLYINGSPVTITPGQNETLQLGGGSYVSVNEKIQTANSLTERVLDVHLAGLADIVVGEAQVTRTASNPCTGTTGGGGGGGGGTLNVCPPGSTYDPVHQVCDIVLPGGTIIIIGPPFKGPTGGTVVALSVARKRYHSACLYGPGPKYVIVGTKRGGHIQGTFRAERILGLGGHELINGGGGNDCIDGRGGNDRITEADGNARVYAGPGKNEIFVRDGNDKIWGGPGKNKISAGRGNDWIWGRSGFDIIYVDNGPKHVFAGRRGGRVYAPGARDAVHCSSRRDVVFVNIFAVRYAARHGCVAIHPLRPAVL